ncbi:hypothetical protein, partial [Mobilicoccus pelagius]|uniref:hypothetical protein n=1 Tax=Mobilicoccus pelagius TaxID=746032 RepID=UPI001C3F479E
CSNKTTVSVYENRKLALQLDALRTEPACCKSRCCLLSKAEQATPQLQIVDLQRAATLRFAAKATLKFRMHSFAKVASRACKPSAAQQS